MSYEDGLRYITFHIDEAVRLAKIHAEVCSTITLPTKCGICGLFPALQQAHQRLLDDWERDHMMMLVSEMNAEKESVGDRPRQDTEE